MYWAKQTSNRWCESFVKSNEGESGNSEIGPGLSLEVEDT